MERLTPEEAGRRASVIYDRDIRRAAERDHDGEFVAIDVDTGHWSFGADFIAATEALRAMGSAAPNACVFRVGYRATASIGGGALHTGP